ncbi:hypothetical protein BS47DRAFT_1334232 [Hydnum rufescens UP504]|uniref:Aminotransferase class I/classII large domain-containing protein n=1 Tax=Hydnum rufescens UP504 TaxID=1448309 RepID=A0A9P6DPK5_9AGAM|nr:hypothetical protein BS47DRAFT_1334232 [Hydnum rufescens UP504]
MHSFQTSRLVLNTSLPPIPVARNWISLYSPRSANEPFIDVSQGVPRSGPPEILSVALADVAGSDEGSAYGPICGDAELHELLVEEMKTVYSHNIDISTKDVALTAGCNLAFFATAMALASFGDEIILPVPWYFNHQMSLQMLGITIVPLPLWPHDEFLPSLNECAALITPRTRAIVLVSPNNPTGAIYPPALLSSFAALARSRQVALILDETYRDFIIPTEASPVPHDLFHSSMWRSNVIHLFSFSKSYAIPGHRLGAIIAAPSFLTLISTVLDSIQICPPRAAQLALARESLLPKLRPYLKDTALALAHRHRLFRTTLQGLDTPAPWIVRTSGAGYFAFVRHPFEGIRGEEVCRRLARDAGVLTLPATFFAPTAQPTIPGDEKRWLRVSVANVDDVQIIAVATRMRAFSVSPEAL